MKGFKVICKSEVGEEALLTDLNANKAAFKVVTVRQKPFVEVDFLFTRKPQGLMIKKMLRLVPEKEALNHFHKKLRDAGAEQGKDYEVMIL